MSGTASGCEDTRGLSQLCMQSCRRRATHPGGRPRAVGRAGARRHWTPQRQAHTWLASTA